MSKTKPEPNYFAVLTADIRYDKTLTPSLKLMAAEIASLCNKYGYCWAANKYFTELFDVDSRTITRWIKILVDKGYVVREIVRNPETQEVVSRKLRLAMAALPTPGTGTPPDTDVGTPPDTDVRYNNKEDNNKKEEDIYTLPAPEAVDIKTVKPSKAEIHPAIKALREVVGKYPAKVAWPGLIETIGDSPDIERMKDCYARWATAGYREMNFNWVRDWYATDTSSNGSGHKQSRPEDDPFWIDPAPPPDYPYILGYQRSQWTEEEYADRQRYEEGRDSWLPVFEKRGREKYELALQQVETYEQSLEFQRRFNLDGMHT